MTLVKMDMVIMSTEIFCFLFLAIIMYGLLFETKYSNNMKRSFMHLNLCVMLSLVFDIISYLPVDWSNHRSFNYYSTLLTYITPIMVSGFFLKYMFEFVSYRTKVSKRLFFIGITFSLLQLVFATVAGISKKLFTITDGVYERGPLFNVYMLSYIVLLAYTVVAVLVNFKKLGLHDSIAAIMFVLIPVVFILVNIILPDHAFAIASQALSIELINYMLMGSHMDELIADSAMNSELAHKDRLTGLFNRLAYTKAFESMNGDGPIGVIYSDLNGLKHTNDTLGHKAGDDLLCTYAELLLGCFRPSDVFRVSGDEFIVLLKGMPLETFERKKKVLNERLIIEGKPIAAAGFRYGRESELPTLLESAELEMYEVKKQFHEAFPDLSRK